MLKKNIFSIVVALIITYLSLTSSHTFDRVTFLNFPWTDKLVHFAMYSGLMAVIVLEHRSQLKGFRKILTVSLIPLSFGVLMELLQALFTSTRTASFLDIIADMAGITAVVFLWVLIRPRHYNSL